MKQAMIAVALAAAWAFFPVRATAAAPEYTVIKGVAYLETAGGPLLDVYLPSRADSSHPKPGFVWIHGGGWSSGDRGGGREVAVCSTLAKAGYVTVSIDYMLSKPDSVSWPVNLQQCKAAIRFLQRYAARYGVDTANIAVGGGSAGAHLAAMAGLTGPKQFQSDSHKGYSDRVKAILDLYGPVSTKGWYGGSVKQMLGVSSVTDPLIAQSSVETYVTKDSPPVFIAHGLIDSTVDVSLSRAFDSVLAKAGVDHKLVLIPRAGHSFNLETYNGKPLSVALKAQVLAWLDARLKPVTALAPGPRATAAGSFLGNAIALPRAWAQGDLSREVTFELRDKEGRLGATGRLRAGELFSGAGAAPSPRPAPGIYALILRWGPRRETARIAVLP